MPVNEQKYFRKWKKVYGDALLNTLNIFGDKWSLLIINDLILHKTRRFNDILNSTKNISTNILAARLKRLEENGIIDKKTYQHSPVRYEYYLTSAGNKIKTLLLELTQWGMTHTKTCNPSMAHNIERK